MAVEFLRQSSDGRMTPVLDGTVAPVRALWAQMNATDLAQAREDLRAREGVPKSTSVQSIGSWPRGDPSPVHIVELDVWAEARGVQHVVWTALPSKFGGEVRTPTAVEFSKRR